VPVQPLFDYLEGAPWRSQSLKKQETYQLGLWGPNGPPIESFRHRLCVPASGCPPLEGRLQPGLHAPRDASDFSYHR